MDEMFIEKEGIIKDTMIVMVVKLTMRAHMVEFMNILIVITMEGIVGKKFSKVGTYIKTS